jgi:subtilisin family serine protease
MRKFRLLFASTLLAASFLSCTAIKKTALEIEPMDTSVQVSERKTVLTQSQLKKWSHADLQEDGIPGISLEKAYDFLAGKKGEKVIVGVIDSGIDIEHEDLRDVLWINTGEIKSNNKDDDNNGYVDDVYGWNFLGGNGEEAPEQYEVTRLYSEYKNRFESEKKEVLTGEDKAERENYKQYEQAYKDASSTHNATLSRLEFLKSCFEGIETALNKSDFTKQELDTIKFKNPMLNNQVSSIKSFFDLGYDRESFNKFYKEHEKTKHFDLDFNGRAIVGDDPSIIQYKKYGNSLVMGSKSGESHGSHVAGIILAKRNNGVGIQGIANNAKLMSLRAVPDGDERDKDVALAIRYAVDNGAKVINMSFGKPWSPNKEWVLDAIKYAEKHDVLLVHAAGNSNENIDIEQNWPNDSKDMSKEVSSNFISVGAIGFDVNEDLLAPFSNYGKKNVDIFAPGVQIYSSVPNNNYDSFSGTSMASPHVAGVAALIRSYYPQFSAKEVKGIILASGSELDMQVLVPGHISMKKRMSSLSASGKLLNAYNAVFLANKLAIKLSNSAVSSK